MKLVTSVTALAAAAFIASIGTASACEWMKNQVTASAAPPAPVETTAPATAVDPLLLAQLEKTAILPAVPTEEKDAVE